MAKRSKDPEERRNQFIEEATKLFIQNGYDKTTVESIIQNVGVAKVHFITILNLKKTYLSLVLSIYQEQWLINIFLFFWMITSQPKKMFRQYLDYNFHLAYTER